MPPPLEEMSDDESSGGSIPFENNTNKEQQEEHKDAGGDQQGANEEGEEGEEEDDEEGLYIVERILGHDFAKDGTLLLQVKWKGYEDPTDQTMEPEYNLIEGAKDLVEDYYKAQGGRPQKPAPKKRKSTGQTKSASENAEPKKPRKSKGAITNAEVPNEAELPDWVPKGKNWENEVGKVDTIMRDETNDLCAYLHWKNGRKSKVSVETCYDRCPKKVSFHLTHSVEQQLTHSKMLKFYESHLVFKD